MEKIKDSAKQLISNLQKKDIKQDYSSVIKPNDPKEPIYDASCFINKKDAHTLPPQPNIDQSEQLPNYKSAKEYKKLILNSKKIKDAIQIVANKRAHEQHLEQQTRLHEFVEQAELEAAKICDQMFANYKGQVTRYAKNFFKVFFTSVYQKIVVNNEHMKAIQNINYVRDGPIVFIPTHRSYLDFLLIPYTLFAYRLALPHIAAAEDFLAIPLINLFLRYQGAFFIKRKQLDENILYWAILEEYIGALVGDQSNLKFFIEGTRSRSGKMLKPKLGLLQMINQLYFDGKVPDVQFVGMTINYDRVLEAETFPKELLGEEKVKESLGRIINAIQVFFKDYGRVYIEFCQPISLKQYCSANFTHQLKDLSVPDFKQKIVKDLGQFIIEDMSKNLVVMPTAMVASLLLIHTRGISEEGLVMNINWLHQEMKARGIKVGGLEDIPAIQAIKTSFMHLKEIISKTKKNFYELQVEPKSGCSNIMLLTYYKNQLIFGFIMEAFCACALYSFGEDLAWKTGVNKQKLLEETQFLAELCDGEYIIKQNQKDMKSRGIIENIPSTNSLRVKQYFIIIFVNSLKITKAKLLYIFVI